MSPFQLVRNSLRFFWRTNVGVVLGTALAALVLTGALLVGDSVRGTLRKQAEARVGRVQEAFIAGERFVRWPQNASERPERVGGLLGPDVSSAGLLLLQGTVARPDQQARANRVQVVGADEAFWRLSPAGNPIALADNQVALNARLAEQLQLAVGAELILRMEKPSAFSKDAPLSGETGDVITIRASVARVVDDLDFGRFALTASQVPPPTIYLPLGPLQNRLGMAGKVNVVLNAAAASAPALTAALAAGKRAKDLLADAELTVAPLPNDLGVEIRTSRVFLDEDTVAAARKNEQAPNGPGHGTDALTYFVNELRVGDGSHASAKSTPYSMVTAIDAPSSGFIPAELADDEITITRWLADDLGVDVGAKITLKYFVMGERRQLVEKSRTFEVLGPILEMSEPQLNTSWMPDFPNVPDKKGFSSWKPGFPFESTRIRKKDEDYWEQYRGTPKAFVNLRVGQEMWGNRWGNLTSIRYSAGTEAAKVERLGSFLNPAALGFRVLALRDQALAATNAPVDFGQLFAGFSFFLILAAAVLTGLLFTFSIEQRAAEAGLLLAVGWRAPQVRRLFLREGLALALIGAVIGALLAALYTKVVLRALSGAWAGATGGVEFTFAPSPVTFAIGIASGVIVALLAMWLASRRLFKLEAAALLSGAGQAELASSPERRAKRVPVLIARALEVLGVLAALYVLVAQPKNAGLFFASGFLLLAAGLSFCFRQIRRIAGTSTDLPSAHALALRNTSRRRGRSLATIGVLASGVFMVVAVDSFRKGPLDDPTPRESGTGGFTLFAESSSPIYEDLNSESGRDQYSLDEQIMAGARVVQMRVRGGDDASCLNLNRAVQPRIVGVNFRELSGRFADASKAKWDAIGPAAEGAIPALVDANTLQWSMQKKIGDVLEYQDDRGLPLRIQVRATFPASILQGVVLIDEREFIRRFPDAAGYSMFLIDCPPDRAAAVRQHLSEQLSDRGAEVVPTAQRLAEFNAVENTYLSIFQVLGGLGLLLGSAGLGIVVARNVLERRREFGLLEAVGFTPRQARSLVFSEHRWLIVFALGIGAISALVAVWPNLAQKGGGFPWMQSALLLLGMAALGAFWTWLATRLSFRGSLLGSLREE